MPSLLLPSPPKPTTVPTTTALLSLDAVILASRTYHRSRHQNMHFPLGTLLNQMGKGDQPCVFLPALLTRRLHNHGHNDRSASQDSRRQPAQPRANANLGSSHAAGPTFCIKYLLPIHRTGTECLLTLASFLRISFPQKRTGSRRQCRTRRRRIPNLCYTPTRRRRWHRLRQVALCEKGTPRRGGGIGEDTRARRVVSNRESVQDREDTECAVPVRTCSRDSRERCGTPDKFCRGCTETHGKVSSASCQRGRTRSQDSPRKARNTCNDMTSIGRSCSRSTSQASRDRPSCFEVVEGVGGCFCASITASTAPSRLHRSCLRQREPASRKRAARSTPGSQKSAPAFCPTDSPCSSRRGKPVDRCFRAYKGLFF